MILGIGDTDPASAGVSYILSYSGYFITECPHRIIPRKFMYEGNEVTIGSPFRLAPSCWRPIPLLDSNGAERIFGKKLENIPLQICGVPCIGQDGTSEINLYKGRGTEYDRNLPSDTIIIDISNVDHNYNLRKIILDVLRPFFSWLRVMTKQWWLGRSIEGQTGNIHFGFESGPEKLEGRAFFPMCSQTAPSRDMLKINDDIWSKALERSIAKEVPPWSDVLLSDISYYLSNGESLTAILLTCGWVEFERNLILENRNLKISSLGVGATDLLKHITVGFEKAIGANAAKDIPEQFKFLRSLWISRGDFAHGKPLRWSFGEFESIDDFTSGRFSQNVEIISDWLSSLRF